MQSGRGLAVAITFHDNDTATMRVAGVARKYDLRIDRHGLAYDTALWLNSKVAEDDEVSNHPLLCLLGRHLYALLFPVELDRDRDLLAPADQQAFDAREQFEESFPDPLRPGERPLRVGLGFEPEASGLAQLPWEFLYRPTRDGGYFLAGRHTQLALTRFASAQPESLPAIDGDLTVLPVVSDPPGREFRPIPATLLPDVKGLASGVKGVKVLDVVRSPRWTQLKGQIEGDRPHIVHIVSHGEPSALWFRAGGGGGGGMLMPASAVADLFDTHTPLLVVLASCDSAAGKEAKDRWFEESASVIEGLVNRRIPAVVAMRYRISAGAAKTFTDAFYGAVFSGERIDHAVERARAALAGETTEQEGYRTRAFGTPVVYVGGDFQLIPRPPAGTGATGVGTGPISTPLPDECPRCDTRIFPDTEVCVVCGLYFICPHCHSRLPTLVAGVEPNGAKRFTVRCGKLNCKPFEHPPWNPAREGAIAG